MRRLILALALLFATHAACAQETVFYKCTDAKGNVSMQNGVPCAAGMKQEVRRIGEGGPEHGKVIAGFAGATADAFTLFERLERKLEQHRGQLMRAAVELAKDWRTDKYLRNLE